VSDAVARVFHTVSAHSELLEQLPVPAQVGLPLNMQF
jgi:hypothetical protein